VHLVALLTIVIWPHGLGADSHRSTLRCPSAATACARLAVLNAPFAPVPPKTACTAIYGGPQVARVTGAFRGRTVWATFRRRDGCEIARWNKVAFLFR
jgi:hypothetical protein